MKYFKKIFSNTTKYLNIRGPKYIINTYDNRGETVGNIVLINSKVIRYNYIICPDCIYISEFIHAYTYIGEKKFIYGCLNFVSIMMGDPLSNDYIEHLYITNHFYSLNDLKILKEKKNLVGFLIKFKNFEDNRIINYLFYNIVSKLKSLYMINWYLSIETIPADLLLFNNTTFDLENLYLNIDTNDYKIIESFFKCFPKLKFLEVRISDIVTDHAIIYISEIIMSVCPNITNFYLYRCHDRETMKMDWEADYKCNILEYKDKCIFKKFISKRCPTIQNIFKTCLKYIK